MSFMDPSEPSTIRPKLIFFAAVAFGGVMLLNWFGGQETVFALSKTRTGGTNASMAMLLALFVVALMALTHLVRVLYIVFHKISRGRYTPYLGNNAVSLEAMGAFSTVMNGGLYAYWLFGTKHGTTTLYWPPALVLAASVFSWLVGRHDWTYGIGYRRQRQRAQDNQCGETGAEVPEIARKKTPSLKFVDIFGNAEIKRRMREAGRSIMASRKAGEEPRNGILMYGGPGNGKTIIAEALAGELGLPLFTLTHSDIASQWVGERTVRIKQAFDQAIRNQPCMLFIDEIDSFIPDRGTSRSQVKEDGDVVNSLLTLLVDIRPHKVLVVAATNYLDRLDPAAVREGRFDFKVEITSPDKDARIGLLTSGVKKHLKGYRVDTATIESLAQRWNDYSVKRILAVTEELPFFLAEQGKKSGAVEFEDFMGALRRIQGQKGASPADVIPLDQLVLPSSIRESVDLIATRLRDPLRVERLGGSLPTGILLHGPAGTGKTSLCKSLAKDVGYAFLPTTGSEMARDLKALENIYSQAKELRPAFIFIDEADELLKAREYSMNTEVTNKLLTLMDGTSDRVRDVIWVAATNHYEQIDPALLRAGRFTEKVEFELPGQDLLEAHVEKWLSKRKVKLEQGLTKREIAAKVGETSIANLEGVLQNAVNRAISRTRDDNVVVSSADVEAAVETVMGE